MSKYLSFELTDAFIERYKQAPVNWGFTDAGGNSLGELTFIRTYSRLKEDGTKERWWEVCERVINGMYSIQKDHAKQFGLPWNDRKAHASAQEAYARLFEFKWTPPGRGLWMMGTEFVMKNGNASALQNCAFISTADIDKSDPGRVFSWLQEACMLGIGVGWDTLGTEKNIVVNIPTDEKLTYVVPDSREGWSEATRLLINSYLRPNFKTVVLDYGLVRPYGSPINGFGGKASGPEPLYKMHEKMREVLENKAGQLLDSVLIADLMNLIGVCVVAGNVRRSAEIGLGRPDDDDFINLKNVEVFPERNSYDPESPGWGWMSNNSLSVEVGQDYSGFVELIKANGEPGFAWLDTMRNYGRLKDNPDGVDYRVMGMNPCGEQPLESFECCTLSEMHINRAESKEDFLRTLKFAYLYGKTVTLMQTHWPETNAVMQRNRRIGLSITGVAGFVDKYSLNDFRIWADEGYEIVRDYDNTYSEWLGVRNSIKTTTIKPSGTVSLLSGATPGVHWPSGGSHYWRAVRFSSDDKIIDLAKKAGYKIEDDIVSDNTVVIYFPIQTDVRSEKEVSVFEKINLAAEAQRWWSDNSVSATVTFSKEEADYLSSLLSMYEGSLKSISFLPMGDKTYPQQPYTSMTEEEYNSNSKLKKMDFDKLYKNGSEAVGEKYCTTDVCLIK